MSDNETSDMGSELFILSVDLGDIGDHYIIIVTSVGRRVLVIATTKLVPFIAKRNYT